jgi:hypothetical protein
MAKHMPANATLWLCLSLLFYFLALTIPSEANANKTRNTSRTATHDRADPGTASPNKESTPPNPPMNAKGGEATPEGNSSESVARLAIETNTETVKRIEAFYSNTVQNFATTLTIIAGLTGAVGITSLGLIAARTSKWQAKKTLRPHKKWYSEFTAKSELLVSDYNAIKSDYEAIKKEHVSIQENLKKENEEYKKLSSEFKSFQQNAIANLQGLRSAMLAWYLIMLYMQNIGKANDDDKPKLEGTRQEAKLYVNQILNRIKPEDKLVLSLTNSVYGIILFYEEKFEAALDAFRNSVEQNNENIPAAFNRACLTGPH